jgi:hypothetical protein
MTAALLSAADLAVSGMVLPLAVTVLTGLLLAAARWLP